jgi:hypothetical protein
MGLPHHKCQFSATTLWIELKVGRNLVSSWWRYHWSHFGGNYSRTSPVCFQRTNTDCKGWNGVTKKRSGTKSKLTSKLLNDSASIGVPLLA